VRAVTKAALRREAVAALRALDPAARARASAVLAAHLWTLPEVAGARTLLLFASTAEEPDTDRIADEARRRGIAVLYPRCLPERALALHAVAAPGALRAGRYGIREPDGDACPVTDVGEVDAALIPGVAFDRAGGRLGRGAGYYDRLLASPGWRAFRCGVFFAGQEVARVPVDPWDVRLDAVVTEAGAVRMEDGRG
jgi:5-formyltetrahydrofolate cyclo-ligase